MERGRPRSPAINEALEKAALSLFADGGVASVTFEQVAARANVSRTALYRRWTSREALIVSALCTYRDKLESGFEDWSERPLNEILEIFIDQTKAAFSNEFARKLMRQLQGLSDRDEQIREVFWATMVEPRRKIFSALIADAQRNGDIETDAAPELIQDLLSGALSYRLLAYPASQGDLDVEPYIRSILKIIGLTPIPGKG